METARAASLQRAKYRRAIEAQDLDSSRTEPFRTGVPHRLPLPPLLSAPTPSGPTAFYSGNSQGSIKPVARRPLAPEPTFAALEDESSVAPVHPYGGPRKLSTSLLTDLKVLSVACSRASRPLAEALCYWNTAVEYESAFMLDDAIRYFKKFMAPCARAGYSPGAVAALSSIAAALYCQGKYQEAIAACETALEALSDAVSVCASTTGGWVSSSLAAASLLNTIGLCFTQVLDYEAAIVAFSRALQHSLQVADQRIEKAICANQASANALVGDFMKAESCLDRHIELSTTLDRVPSQKVEETLGFQMLSQDTYESLGMPGVGARVASTLETAATLSKMGSLARIHGEMESSRQFYQRAYNLALKSGDFGHVMAASCALGVAKGTTSFHRTVAGLQGDTVDAADEADVEANILEEEGGSHS